MALWWIPPFLQGNCGCYDIVFDKPVINTQCAYEYEFTLIENGLEATGKVASLGPLQYLGHFASFLNDKH